MQQALQHHKAGRWAQAAALYGELCRSQPMHFEAHLYGGGVALQLGRLEEAARCLTRAAQINPRSTQALVWLGVALAQAGECAGAEQQLRAALKIDPASHETWAHLASVLVIGGKLDDANGAYRKALSILPNSAQYWTSLGSALQIAGRGGESVECHTRALSIDPKEPKAQANRAQALLSLHRVAEALDDFDSHLRRFPDDLSASSFRLFLLHYPAEIRRDWLAEEHRAFGRKAAAAAQAARRLKPAPANPSRNAAEPGKRLRVAFLSPDLRGHSVAYFLEPLLSHLDRSLFEVVLYHDHPVVDGTSDRLRSQASLWRNFIGKTQDQVEAQIRADAPDILVDLAGHTGFNRMPLYALRPAPVQITYLGYPNTTGLAEMDFRLTDGIADPEGDSDAFHTEKLVRFSSCAWTYSPAPDAPEPAPAPCLAGEPFTFGSFNSLSKVNDATLRLWAEVLRAVPGSRLLLKTFAIDEPLLRRRAEAAGIPKDQFLVLPGGGTTVEHLGAYSRLDVALDPFPYHGTTTTCEALWMGVPVVSLKGDRHSARVGASLLAAVGHSEWTAADPAAYVRVAAELASDRARLAATRARLREEMRASVLLDHVAQSRRFSAALRACWQSHCGQSAAVDALIHPQTPPPPTPA